MRIAGNVEIERKKPGILLISHGEYAVGLLDSVKLITGNTQNTLALILEAGDDIEKFKEEMFTLIGKFPAGVLIFLDLFGGTPSNQFLLGANKITSPFLAFCGMNLPMVLEAVTMRKTSTFDEIREMVLEAGRESIVYLNDCVKQLYGESISDKP